jgi:hypothetical protein
MHPKEQLTQDMKEAMKSGDSTLRDLLRTLSAAVKQVEIDSRKEVSEEEVYNIFKKEVKKRQETIVDLQKAGRDTAQELYEMGVIERYLPQSLSADQIKAIAQEVIAELGVSSAKEMGNVMKALMPRLKGAADGKTVNEVVRALLN